MLTPRSDLLSRFAAIVGDRHVITDADTIAPHLVEPRGIHFGSGSVIVRPGNVAEVSALLKLANETRTPVVPQGGNTGLVGGQLPYDDEIILSLTRLNAIRALDATSNTMTCEAGVVLAQAQKAADDAERLFPLSLGSEGSCTIGGNLSTNAGGTAAIQYGTARDLVLGVEVVLADGRVMNALNRLKKDNTGYDLRNIFIGAEGTLGIITAAVLKLFAKPRAVATAYIGVKNPADALQLLSAAQASGAGMVTSFELISRLSMEFALKHGPGTRDPLAAAHPWYVLLEIAGHDGDALRGALETLLSEAVERGIVEDATIAATIEQQNSFWHLRVHLSDAQKPEGGSIKQDVSVPVSSIPEFLDEASAMAVKVVPGARVVAFGHLGDGNIHFNVSQPEGADKKAYLARQHDMNDAINAIVMKYGGSISAEHGIGVLKRDLLPGVKDKVALEVMRSLKSALDPNNILNPGKVLPAP